MQTQIFYQNIAFFFPQTVTHASPFLVQIKDTAKTESAPTRASALLATKASTVKLVNKWKMSTNATFVDIFFNKHGCFVFVRSYSAALRE